MYRRLALAAAAALLAACTQMSTMSSYKAPMKDGEAAVPADYKSWPKMLSAVQRPDAKQVREMYIDPKGSQTKAGDAFPVGTVMVMENFAAVAKPDGTLETGPDGKLVKGPLLRIFIMEKAKGAGQDVPEALRNGEWVYASFGADGKKIVDENYAPCRACHLPLGEKKDFVQRYDEYFAKRSG
ncbi:MAG TPA: cytochrome P460 family protein [Casimicrobiaceae bacterium]|nr:cytochrome P460 family protein [Casimicrobiaceae bacterium]